MRPNKLPLSKLKVDELHYRISMLVYWLVSALVPSNYFDPIYSSIIAIALLCHNFHSTTTYRYQAGEVRKQTNKQAFRKGNLYQQSTRPARWKNTNMVSTKERNLFPTIQPLQSDAHSPSMSFQLLDLCQLHYRTANVSQTLLCQF